jgi:predicted acyl esterase
VVRSRADEIVHEHRVAEPLVPGTPVSLDFNLNPTANLFKRGHRLRLEIGSRPNLLKATVFDGFVFFPYEPTLYPARNTIFMGGSEPSFLELEVRQG